MMKHNIKLLLIALMVILLLAVSVIFYINRSNDQGPLRWAKNLLLQDIEKIELVVQPSTENERYRYFEKDEYTDVIALINESKGSYISNPEPLSGQSIAFYITTMDGVRHTFINSGNTYLVIDGIAYRAGYDWLSSWRYTKGNTTLPPTFSFENKKRLTMDELKKIAKKGELISWEDFDPFDGRDVGFGMYIMNYPISEQYYVTVGGIPQEPPRYVRLNSTTAEKFIDIRKDSIDDFVRKE